MTITSKFYTGPVNNLDWTEGTDRLGYRYVAHGIDDFKVSVNGSSDRGYSVADGEASGVGIHDTNDAPILGNLPFSASATWHLIGIRRRWGATNASTIYSIAGNATKQLPTRPVTPGTEDVAPLALAFVPAGGGGITSLVDLRCISGNAGVMVATDDLVRTFMVSVGTRIRIGKTEWTRVIDATSGNAAWEPLDYTSLGGIDYELPVSSGSDAIGQGATNWQVQASSRVRRFGKMRHVHLTFRRSAGTFQFDNTAGKAPARILVAKLWDSDEPPWRTPVAASIITTAGNEYAAGVFIENDGSVILTSGPPTGTVGPAGPDNTLTIDATYSVS